MVPDYFDRGNAETFDLGVRRSRRWRIIAITTVVNLMIVSLVWLAISGVRTLVGNYTWPFRDSALIFAQGLQDIPDVASVDPIVSRSIDDTTEENQFITVRAVAGATITQIESLATVLSKRLRDHGRDDHVMIELAIGTDSVGISHVAALNGPRLDLMRKLSTVEGVVGASVLWRDSGDLIANDTNIPLDIVVQSITESPSNIVSRIEPIARQHVGTVTAVNIGTNQPREHAYDWSYASQRRGERSIILPSIAIPSELKPTLRQLDKSPSVFGYYTDTSDIFVAVRVGTDRTTFLKGLDLPRIPHGRIFYEARLPDGTWDDSQITDLDTGEDG